MGMKPSYRAGDCGGNVVQAAAILFRMWMKHLLPALLFAVPICGSSAPADYDARRQAMMREVEAMVRETRSWLGTGALDERVMQAMAVVPRHEFVPMDFRDLAYANRPLPIGEDQTISQPYIVALMTHLAGLSPGSRVLEIGTGSGYQAAVLAELAAQVYTIEIIPALGQRAEALLQRLGYANVSVRIGDGHAGWAEHAPYDAILVTAAPEQVPEPLLDQLKPGGRLVIPVGRQLSVQSLQLITRGAEQGYTTVNVLPVGFVPLTRGE